MRSWLIRTARLQLQQHREQEAKHREEAARWTAMLESAVQGKGMDDREMVELASQQHPTQQRRGSNRFMTSTSDALHTAVLGNAKGRLMLHYQRGASPDAPAAPVR